MFMDIKFSTSADTDMNLDFIFETNADAKANADLKIDADADWSIQPSLPQYINLRKKTRPLLHQEPVPGINSVWCNNGAIL